MAEMPFLQEQKTADRQGRQLLLHCRHSRHPWRSDGGNAVFAGAKNGGPQVVAEMPFLQE